MSKKEAKEVEAKEAKPQDDNLVDVLKDFNEGDKGSSENVDTKEAEEETKRVEDEPSKNWLIDNKFENSEEGVSKLANAYKELQSNSDKQLNDYKSKMKRFDKLAQLDKVLAQSPTVVQAMQDELINLKEGATKSPNKPDDYDILDETVEGTPSYEWRQKYDKHLIDSGRSAAKEEVDSLRQEMAQKDANRARISKLKDMGMENEEINEYFKFMTEKKNLTDANFVPIWRLLSGKEDLSTSKQNTPSNSVPEPRRITAAAVEGKAPEQMKSDDKAKGEFWDSIMKSARKA